MKGNGLIVSVLAASLLFSSFVASAQGLPHREEGNMSPLGAVWEAGWRIAAFIALWGLLYAPFVLLAKDECLERPGPPSYGCRLYLEATGAGTVLLAGGAMLHFIDRRPLSLSSLGFSAEGLGQDVALGTALGTGTLALTLGLLWGGGWLRPAPEGKFAWSVLPLAALNVLLNAFAQEVLVRGYPWQALQTRLGPTAAWIGSSLLFAAVHYGAARGAPLPLFNHFLSGLLYGYAYLATGNLWTAVALHWAWNFVSGPLLGLNVSGRGLAGSPLYYGWSLVRIEGPELWTGGSYGFEGGLAHTLATVIGLLGLYLAYPQALHTSSGEPTGPSQG